MWEKTDEWALPTKVGTLTFDEILFDDELKFDDTLVPNVSVVDHCNSCNLPGGGQGKKGVLPHGQTKPCSQSQDERGRCPHIESVMKYLLHESKRCDTMHCERCQKKGQLGVLKVGEILMVSGIRTVIADNPQGGKTPIQIGARRAGRYLGTERGSGMLRFEGIQPGDGPTGRRFWLTASGHLLDEPDDADREFIETGEMNRQGGIYVAKTVPPG